jgi:hypothetical protein
MLLPVDDGRATSLPPLQYVLRQIAGSVAGHWGVNEKGQDLLGERLRPLARILTWCRKLSNFGVEPSCAAIQASMDMRVTS